MQQDDLMTATQAVVLGIVQGLGEFLPISSSGHLIVFPWLLGWPEHSLAFDVALHLGTLGAVLYAFAGDWWRLCSAGVSGLRQGKPWGTPDARTLWLLAAASVPGAVAGLLLEHWADTVFRNPLLVAGTMTALGAVLFFADRQAASGDQDRDVGLRDALLIGVAQALAIVPGVSRSGATISMALVLGYPRERAARFSFLLATPITFGAAMHKLPDLVRGGGPHDMIAIGVITAGLVGFLAIRGLLAYVRTRDYRPFVWYRFAFAALVVALSLFRG